MTNEQAIIELRDLISDDNTDRENEALLFAIEKLRDKRPQGTYVKLDDKRRFIKPIMIDWWRSEDIEYVMSEIEQKAYIWK